MSDHPNLSTYGEPYVVGGNEPHLSTYHEVVPLVYSWSTPDIPKLDGWQKIGETVRTAEERIAEQGSQVPLDKVLNWEYRAMFTSPQGGFFGDTDFHEYLKRQGIERYEEKGKRKEWFKFDGGVDESKQLFRDFAGQQITPNWGLVEEDYTLRPEQEDAVLQTLEAFDSYDEMLWNAKPRFGKTLTAYDLMNEMDAKTVLIVTNRPAIANSWYDDFAKFIAHQMPYYFISESDSLSERKPMSREEFLRFLRAHHGEDIRRIEFVSLQDLKGSEAFGGKYDKNKYISDLNWDLLIVDEAHEGVDTLKTDVAFDQIKRNKTLHLSGTPFKAIAKGKFSEDQIYNWTYEDEQEAKRNWVGEPGENNPYRPLPTLNLYTYQMSRMIEDQLSAGAVGDDLEAENLDFTFDLNEFFSTNNSGYFKHEAEVIKFLDRLSENEKYPFSTPELRDEIRHSFWLLDRVASAKALKRLLNVHPVFKDYEIVLAAGDRKDDEDTKKVGKALDEVRAAIANAEGVTAKEKEAGGKSGKTITLSVGQLTTGVTIPEWTAVMMLSNMQSAPQYMQAAFRAQNPCMFERSGKVLEKKNAYVFDFAPERTLTIFNEFANDLNPTPVWDSKARQNNIATLLNFFPVIGEDSEGTMGLLDAKQILTLPQVFKAREVVRRGFMSNLLFDNITGVFRDFEHYEKILNKLPVEKEGRIRGEEGLTLPESLPEVDEEGNAIPDKVVISEKAELLGKPVWNIEDLSELEPESSTAKISRYVEGMVSEKNQETLEKAKEEYGLTKAQVESYDREFKQKAKEEVKRLDASHKIATKRIKDKIEKAPTQSEAESLMAQKKKKDEEYLASLIALGEENTDLVGEEIATREEKKKSQRKVNKVKEDSRSRLRGFARTIPMFLMAYGDRDLRLYNFEDYTPDGIFKEITNITKEEFCTLRDGYERTEEDGSITQVPGLFNAAVFDQAVQEFLDKKEELADYFDPNLTENIFAYIPQQKTSLVFTPEPVVQQMVDLLEEENPGIFSDPTKTFADLFSTAGLFLMEIVRRLDEGLRDQIPDQQERLHHILTSQVYEMAHNELLHRITMEAVSGGDEERRAWMEDSGHFLVGNLAEMTPEERQEVVDEMLSGRNQ